MSCSRSRARRPVQEGRPAPRPEAPVKRYPHPITVRCCTFSPDTQYLIQMLQQQNALLVEIRQLLLEQNGNSGGNNL